MRTILIVEDEEYIREILAMLFTDAGYRVRVAVHGGDALAQVAEELPDLILSDVMMPVLDGAALCRQLKGQVGTRQIPIILMSAVGSDGARDAGADAFIDKPFDLETLEGLVGRLLRRPGSS
jgi:CheY-like chemotaxis protein